MVKVPCKGSHHFDINIHHHENQENKIIPARSGFLTLIDSAFLDYSLQWSVQIGPNLVKWTVFLKILSYPEKS